MAAKDWNDNKMFQLRNYLLWTRHGANYFLWAKAYFRKQIIICAK